MISERKLDGLSSDLVNGDHLSIPGMRDYSYGSLGSYNQMSPSPKSITPQSPSTGPMSYTVGKLLFFFFFLFFLMAYYQVLELLV